MSVEQRKAIGTIAYMGGIMSLPEPFVWSWTQLVEYSNEALCQTNEYIKKDRSRMSLHDMARNELVSRMKGDWIMMLDTDMEFDPDVCARLVMLMYRHDLDVVTGLYPYKGNPALPILHMYNEETKKHEIIGSWPKDANLFEVDSGGAGCLLIRRRCLEKVIKEGKAFPFERIGSWGEDFSFFSRVRQVGMKVYCAWRVQCGHLTYNPLYLAEVDMSQVPVVNSYAVSGFMLNESGSIDLAGAGRSPEGLGLVS